MLTPIGITYRRALLDTQLTKLAAATLGGRVLDVGGRRQVRGRFRPPAGIVWIRVNIDPGAQPDIVADAQALPVRSGTEECVVCLETLEYVHDPDVAVAEMSRVLRPGGRLLVSVPLLHRVDSATDRHRFTGTRLRELLEGAGLGVVEITPQGRFFTTLANMLREATAAIASRPLRWAVATCTVPLGAVLLRIDRLSAVRRSGFLSSFTTGFLGVAVKPGGGGPLRAGPMTARAHRCCGSRSSSNGGTTTAR
jgi:SAM-dependent methyltransferase